MITGLQISSLQSILKQLLRIAMSDTQCVSKVKTQNMRRFILHYPSTSESYIPNVIQSFRPVSHLSRGSYTGPDAGRTSWGSPSCRPRTSCWSSQAPGSRGRSHSPPPPPAASCTSGQAPPYRGWSSEGTPWDASAGLRRETAPASDSKGHQIIQGSSQSIYLIWPAPLQRLCQMAGEEENRNTILNITY